MGICLHYTTAEAVEPDVAEAILADAERVNRDRFWLLCEPVIFYPRTEEGQLAGRSKLTLLPHPEELAEAGPIVPEDNDLQALVNALCGWSSTYGLTWRLSIEGEAIGDIAEGVCEERIWGAIDAMAGLAQELAELPPDEPLPDRELGSDRPTLRIWREPEE
jgi:hypothetical protein